MGPGTSDFRRDTADGAAERTGLPGGREPRGWAGHQILARRPSNPGADEEVTGDSDAQTSAECGHDAHVCGSRPQKDPPRPPVGPHGQGTGGEGLEMGAQGIGVLPRQLECHCPRLQRAGESRATLVNVNESSCSRCFTLTVKAGSGPDSGSQGPGSGDGLAWGTSVPAAPGGQSDPAHWPVSTLPNMPQWSGGLGRGPSTSRNFLQHHRLPGPHIHTGHLPPPTASCPRPASSESPPRPPVCRPHQAVGTDVWSRVPRAASRGPGAVDGAG